jgi:ABC-type transport system involved in cytochrome c biogenesis permease subunit
MNALSVIIGIAALIGALVAFIPLLGWLNWLILPVAVIGLVLGLLAKNKNGRNINLVVLAISLFRLFIGGGIL